MIKIKISKQLQWTIWIVLITITTTAMFWLVQPVKSASIFTDDFESGNLTAWDSSSGEDISASTASKKNGTYGMQVTDLTDATADYVQDNLNNTEVYVRVYIDPNSATLRTAWNAEIVFLQLSDAGTQEYVLEAGIKKNATSGYDIRMIGQNDSSSWDVNCDYMNITDDWHLIEMRWKAGTGANGIATLWIDEVQKYTKTNRDTNNYTVDRIRLGTVRSLSSSHSGTLYWDDYASDDSSYIGPPVPTSTPSPTPTPTSTPTPTPTPTSTPTPTLTLTLTPTPIFCVKNEDCQASQFCEFEACLPAPGGMPPVPPSGICVDVPNSCPVFFAPPVPPVVCGCNGKTYTSDCDRRMAKVSKKHDGACTDITCYDSDGGKNYEVKGTVVKGLESKTDVCDYCTGACPPEATPGSCVADCGAVKEYYCDGDNIVEIVQQCPKSGCVDGACISISCPSKELGDANCDGAIDGIDYSFWLNSQCRPSATQLCANTMADFNGDGNVDDSDYLIWFKNRFLPTLTITPSPTSIVSPTITLSPTIATPSSTLTPTP